MTYFLIIWYLIGLFPCLILIAMSFKGEEVPLWKNLLLAFTIGGLFGPIAPYRIWKTMPR